MKKLLILTALLTLTGCIQPSSQLAAAFHANSNHYIPSDNAELKAIQNPNYEADQAKEELAKENSIKGIQALAEDHRREAIEDRALFDKVRREGPLKPSNAVEAEYYRYVNKIHKLSDIANQAGACNFRSEQWVNTFDLGNSYMLRAEMDRLEKKSANPGQFVRYAIDLIKSTFVGMPMPDCGALFNSKEMAVLDVLVYKMTGGYH